MGNAHLQTAQQNVQRVEDAGDDLLLRGTRDGAMVTVPWLLALAIEGRVFGANMGVDVTAYDADTSAGTPALLVQQPSFGLDVPDGTACIPLSIIVQILTHTGTTENFLEICAGVAPSATLLGAGTSTPLTSIPMRTDGVIASNCTARGPYTANAAVDIPGAVGYLEFFRSGYQDDIDVASMAPGNLHLNEGAAHHEWSALDKGMAPVLVGSGAYVIFTSSTSDDGVITGFLTTTWVELAESVVR
jgi:hypothetical protein